MLNLKIWSAGMMMFASAVFGQTQIASVNANTQLNTNTENKNASVVSRNTTDAKISSGADNDNKVVTWGTCPENAMCVCPGNVVSQAKAQSAVVANKECKIIPNQPIPTNAPQLKTLTPSNNNTTVSVNVGDKIVLQLGNATNVQLDGHILLAMPIAFTQGVQGEYLAKSAGYEKITATIGTMQYVVHIHVLGATVTPKPILNDTKHFRFDGGPVPINTDAKAVFMLKQNK